MEAFLNSFLLVFASEMGDKTQLLTLVLTTRFKKPWTILAGVFVATLLNHALAASLGVWISSLVSPQHLLWILAVTFFAFGLWILIPDKEENWETRGHWGAFGTTVVMFFIAEMGDKTQLATIALGARYAATAWVTLGSTMGMLASNALAIFMGQALLKKFPMKWVRLFACLLFFAFGLGLLLMQGK